MPAPATEQGSTSTKPVPLDPSSIGGSDGNGRGGRKSLCMSLPHDTGHATRGRHACSDTRETTIEASTRLRRTYRTWNTCS